MTLKTSAVRNISMVALLAGALIPTTVPSKGQVYCPPAVRPRNPAPTQVKHCLREVQREFNLNEVWSRTLVLERGKGYWFSASGCPKMGNIGLYITDEKGQNLKEDSGYSPSLCFRPPATGKYTIKVKALSLMRSYRSGTIDACFSESGCW